MKTLDYTCRHCNQTCISPFGNPAYGTPDICPGCWKLLPIEHRNRILYGAERERRRLRRALKRAEAIAADPAAHPVALEACVEGLARDTA